MRMRGNVRAEVKVLCLRSLARFTVRSHPLSIMGQYQTRASKTSESEEPVVRDDNTLLVGETIVDQPLKDEGAPPLFGSPIDSE